MMIKVKFSDVDSNINQCTSAIDNYRFQNGVELRLEKNNIFYSNPNKEKVMLKNPPSLHISDLLSVFAIYDFTQNFCEAKLREVIEYVSVLKSSLSNYTLGCSKFGKFQNERVWQRETATSSLNLEVIGLRFKECKLIFNDEIKLDLRISSHEYWINIIVFYFASLSDKEFDDFLRDAIAYKFKNETQELSFDTYIKLKAFKKVMFSIFGNEKIVKKIKDLFMLDSDLTFGIEQFDANIVIYVDRFSAKPYKVELEDIFEKQNYRISINTLKNLILMNVKNEDIKLMGMEYLLNLCEGS